MHMKKLNIGVDANGSLFYYRDINTETAIPGISITKLNVAIEAKKVIYQPTIVP